MTQSLKQALTPLSPAPSDSPQCVARSVLSMEVAITSIDRVTYDRTLIDMSRIKPNAWYNLDALTGWIVYVDEKGSVWSVRKDGTGAFYPTDLTPFKNFLVTELPNGILPELSVASLNASK